MAEQNNPKSKKPKKNVKSTTKVQTSKIKLIEAKNEYEYKAPDEKNRGGRKELYSDKVQPYLENIRTYIRCGCTEEEIRKFYHVGAASWNKYKKDHPELADTLYQGKHEFKIALVNNAYRVATGYKYTEVTTNETYDADGILKEIHKQVSEKYAKPDAGMLMFLLINRFSDEFARDPQMVELRRKALDLAEEGKININTGEV